MDRRHAPQYKWFQSGKSQTNGFVMINSSQRLRPNTLLHTCLPPTTKHWCVLKSSADGLFSPCLWLGSHRQHPPDLSCTRSFHSAQTLRSLYVWYPLRIQCISNTSQAYTIKHSNPQCTGVITFLSKNQLQYSRHIYIYRYIYLYIYIDIYIQTRYMTINTTSRGVRPPPSLAL